MHFFSWGQGLFQYVHKKIGKFSNEAFHDTQKILIYSVYFEYKKKHFEKTTVFVNLQPGPNIKRLLQRRQHTLKTPKSKQFEKKYLEHHYFKNI